MKNLLIAIIVVFGAVAAFAQGTVVFANRVTGIIVTHVYAPNPTDSSSSLTGNAPNDTPSGSQNYTGFPLIGASGLTGQYSSAGTFAQLFGAPGANQLETTLQLALPITTFRTGPAMGNVALHTATFQGIPEDFPMATLQMRVWDNSSGLYPTWADAELAWLGGIIAAGKSPLWNQDRIGGQQNAPPLLISGLDPTEHLESFNIYFVPEPATIALTGLAAVVLLLLHPRKAIKQGR